MSDLIESFIIAFTSSLLIAVICSCYDVEHKTKNDQIDLNQVTRKIKCIEELKQTNSWRRCLPDEIMSWDDCCDY